MGNRGKLRSGLLRLAVVLGVGGLLGGCGYDQVVHTWVAYSEESSVPEGPKLPGHMYLVRGLTSVYSFGIDQLAAKINHRGVTATVYSLSETGTIANDIARKYKAGEERGPIMLLGHSSGADYAIAIAERLNEVGVPVALAFGFDPTRTAAAVPGNVELFINLYQGANIIGGGEVQPGPDFRGRLIDVDLREHTEIVHITLDKTPAVQDAVADKVIAVAAYAAAPKGAAAAAPGWRRNAAAVAQIYRAGQRADHIVGCRGSGEGEVGRDARNDCFDLSRAALGHRADQQARRGSPARARPNADHSPQPLRQRGAAGPCIADRHAAGSAAGRAPRAEPAAAGRSPCRRKRSRPGTRGGECSQTSRSAARARHKLVQRPLALQHGALD
jgi:hypothetical protein